MQYMLLIYRAESLEPLPGSPEFDQLMQGYTAFSEEVKAANVFVAGDALDKIESATTIRVRNNKTETTDGPFAETKEQFGGYYILECKDLDEVTRYAVKIPSAKVGGVEIRPIIQMDMLEN